MVKQVSEKDRLYMEMKAIHKRLGQVLKEYEAHMPVAARAPESLHVIDPVTGKPFKKAPSRKAKKP